MSPLTVGWGTAGAGQAVKALAHSLIATVQTTCCISPARMGVRTPAVQAGGAHLMPAIQWVPGFPLLSALHPKPQARQPAPAPLCTPGLDAPHILGEELCAGHMETLLKAEPVIFWEWQRYPLGKIYCSLLKVFWMKIIFDF